MRLFFAQAQLGLLTSFLHIFAVLALGLSWMLVLWQLGPRARDTEQFRFWLRVFALTAYCALGLGLMTMIHTGLVLPLAVKRMGNVLGPLLLATVLTVFLIKSTAFGVVLYSRHRVTSWVFGLCLLMTAIGLTAVVCGMAIIESWMRNPAGAIFLDGQFRVHDWLEVIANPQLPLQASYLGLAGVLMLSSALISSWALQARLSQASSEPSGLVRAAAWSSLFATFAVIPLGLQIVQQSGASASVLVTVLAGQFMQTPYEVAITYTARMFLFVWSLHVLVVLVALMQMYLGRSQSQPGFANRLVLIGAASAPMLCLILWWLIFLGKTTDMVVGQLPVADLLSEVQTQYLFLGLLICVALAGLFLAGWIRLTYQALADGVVTVHRPGVVLS